MLGMDTHDKEKRLAQEKDESGRERALATVVGDVCVGVDESKHRQRDVRTIKKRKSEV